MSSYSCTCSCYRPIVEGKVGVLADPYSPTNLKEFLSISMYDGIRGCDGIRGLLLYRHTRGGPLKVPWRKQQISRGYLFLAVDTRIIHGVLLPRASSQTGRKAKTSFEEEKDKGPMRRNAAACSHPWRELVAPPQSAQNRPAIMPRAPTGWCVPTIREYL